MLKRCLVRTENLTEDSLYIDENAFWTLKEKLEELGEDEEFILINNE